MSQDMNGLYQVSSLGRVKFLNYNHTKKEKITNGSINHNGYYRVNLSKKGKVKYYPVNRLVAETFLDKTNFKYWYTEDPKEINVNNLVVNHKDENPANNSVDNLEWCTPMYNNYYSRLKHTKSIQCVETGIVYSNKHSASAHTGIHPVCIISACAGRQKTAGGYHWKYVCPADFLYIQKVNRRGIKRS